MRVRPHLCILLVLAATQTDAYAQDAKARRRAAHRARMEKKARKLAAGHVPCQSSLIEIEDLETTWTTMAFTARCNGKAYRCSVQGPVMVPITRCFRSETEDDPVLPSRNRTTLSKSPAPSKRPIRAKTILVFPIEDSTGNVGDDIVRNLTDYVGVQLARTGRYRLVPREQLRDRLRDQSKQTYRACYDEACQIELGKELAAEKIASSKLYAAGSTCILTITIFDLRAAASEKAASSKSDCSAPALFASVEQVTSEISAAGTLGEPLPEEPAGSHLVAFTSDPPGARVFVDGTIVCDTPCQSRLPRGDREIRMQKLGYTQAKRTITVDERTPPVTLQLVEVPRGKRKPLRPR